MLNYVIMSKTILTKEEGADINYDIYLCIKPVFSKFRINGELSSQSGICLG